MTTPTTLDEPMNALDDPRCAVERIARVWMMDLRRKSFVEVGGTARPSEVWRCVHDRIGTDAISVRGMPVSLSPAQVKMVRRKARELAAMCVAADSHALI